MNPHDVHTSGDSTARPWLALAMITLVPVLVGVLAAPQILRLLLWLNQFVDLGPHFSNPPLRRVVSRTVMVLAVLGLFPALRWAGIRNPADLGWTAIPYRWRMLSSWWAVGVISMAAAYLFSYFIGALYVRPRTTELWMAAFKWTTLLLSALVIGCVEETLFRGFLFNLLRRRLSLSVAALAASLFFAGVHFLRPREPAALEPTQWFAGFRLLAHLTDGVQRQYAAPMFVNLFLMGVVLCLLFERQKALYALAGLHAGWIWMQGVGTFLFDRSIGQWQMLFGNSETISMTWLGTIVLFFFLIAVGRPLFKQRGNAFHGTS
jgi:membrane protease YdiL (CAAX protease family)